MKKVKIRTTYSKQIIGILKEAEAGAKSTDPVGRELVMKKIIGFILVAALSLALAPHVYAGRGLTGLIKPLLVRPVFLWAMALTHPVGRMMNVVLLGALYYGLVTPLAMTFRLAGRDVLRRRRPNVPTYWVAKVQNRDVGRYLRQYQKQ